MNKNIEYAQNLLEEFIQLCESNGIKFLKTWGPEEIGAGVAISSKDARKLLEIFRNDMPSGRAYECWDNNEHYPDPTIRYVGLDSTCFNIIDYPNYKYHGIFVEVEIIRKRGQALVDIYASAIERSIIEHSYNFKEKKPATGRKAEGREKLYKFALKRGGDAGVRKRAFTQVLNEHSPKFDDKLEMQLKMSGITKTYSEEYIQYSVVDADIDSREYFAETNKPCIELGAKPLEDVRARKLHLDRIRRKNAANMTIARECWDEVQRVHAEIEHDAENPEE